MAPTVFVIALVVFSLFLLFSAVKVVPQGYEYTVESFGRYTKTMKPGLHLIRPFIDQIGRRINVMEQVVDIPGQEVITKDNAMVQTDAVAFIQVMDPAAAAYEVSDLNRAITNLAMTNVRTVIGSLDLDEVLSKRDDINERLLKVIDAATHPWGIKVTRVEIKDLSPPADITEAMARQMKAERVKRADILQAEGQRQSAILRAEGEKQSAILEAEGRREAAYRDSEARERLAEAEAKATSMVSEAIAKGDIQAVNYFVAQQYVKAFEKLATSPQQKLVIVPAEMSSLAASIGGVGQLAQAAFDGGDGPKSKPSGSVPMTDGR